MKSDTDHVRTSMSSRYYSSPRHTIQVDYVSYCDMLAELVGCRPHARQFILNDRKLAMAIWFTGNTPYMYRLVGPDTWPGAREAVLKAAAVMRPVHGRNIKSKL